MGGGGNEGKMEERKDGRGKEGEAKGIKVRRKKERV